MKGRAGDEEPSKERKEQEESMGPAGEMELQKHIELVSGYQIPAPSGTSVGMTFLEDRGTGSRMMFIYYYLFRVVSLMPNGVILTHQLQSRPSLVFFPSQKNCFHKFTM